MSVGENTCELYKGESKELQFLLNWELTRNLPKASRCLNDVRLNCIALFLFYAELLTGTALLFILTGLRDYLVGWLLF